MQTTTIIPVIDETGATVMAGDVWVRPNSILFEIVDGPHAGKRGPDIEIADLVGPIAVDWTQASDYSSGERRPYSREKTE